VISDRSLFIDDVLFCSGLLIFAVSAMITAIVTVIIEIQNNLKRILFMIAL
jgi:hypothetical protein